jgi:tRNA(Ile)-lysidine synthase
MKKDFSNLVSDFFTINALGKPTLVVGVSGGVDSMVLLHLLQTSHFPIIVAHCNFILRGKESNEDEAFVVNYCHQHGIRCLVKQFQTESIAREKGISIEMAARELRYTWFEELLEEYKAKYIAIAHNQNDSIETFFLNLTRGTGIKGLQGIKSISGNIIRPLIALTRVEIEAYASSHQLEYRTDSTNLTDIYRRNFIRHNIIPLFEEMNPSFMATMEQNMSLLTSYSTLIEGSVDAVRTNISKMESEELHLDIDELTALPGWKSILFEILYGYGFTPGEIENTALLVKAQTGKRIESATHTLWKNRNSFVVAPNISEEHEIAIISTTQGELTEPVELRWESKIFSGESMPRKASIAVFDPEALTFPLTLRRWKPGDTFTPSGMYGSKKVSDFLTDMKLDSQKRSKTLVLESGNKIAWIVGIRISEQFRKHGKTGPAVVFQLKNS